MADDLYDATKYKLRVTSAFRDLNIAIKNFKQKYSPTPWLRKYDSRYPAYFLDKPEWRRNGKLFINNHEFPTVSSDPVLQDGVTRNSPIYGGSFIGNDYIKYWWPHSLHPNDSGKWWYKKREYSKAGDPPMATPGVSNHGWGISVDLHQDIFKNKKAIDWMADNMLNYGWSREELFDDQWHITYYIVAFATPLVISKMEDLKKTSAIKVTFNKVNPNIVSATKKVSSTPALASLPIKQIVVNENNNSATPNFQVSSRSTSTPFQTGGGAFGRQTTVTSGKFAVLPSLKNLDGLSPKIFRVAKPYNGSSDPGDFLTYDEFFEMMIHPLVGNFSFGLAAVFTAIAAREGNLGENMIGIGVANGSEHLGFLQIRCKPESTDDFSKRTGWVGESMLWSVPYNENGEPILTSNNKKYAWEAFIKDPNIIKEIKAKASSELKASQKSGSSLFENNSPKLRRAGNGDPIYDAADRKNAASYLANWAMIPANQVWMMKSRFSLTPNYLEKQLTNIKFPFIPQISIVTDIKKPWPQKGFMLNPWNVGSENTWMNNVDANRAYNVLINWFMKHGANSETGGKPTKAQAKTAAMKELTDLASYMETGKKNAFNSWLNYWITDIH